MRSPILLMCLGLSLALGGQQAGPTFRSGVDLVPVDVTVLGKDGRPVSDLTAGDFTLTVDGRPRTVVSAAFIAARRLDEGPPDRASFSTNVGQRPGRLIALVVDEAHIRRGSARATLAAAASFIRSLDRADRVALFLIPGAGPVSGFTANHALVLRLLERAAGQATEAEFSARVGVAEAIEILDRPPDPDRPNNAAPGSMLEAVLSRECAGENTTASLANCRRMVDSEARMVLTQSRTRTTRSLVALRGVFDQLATTQATKTVVLLTEGIILGRDMGDITWVGAQAARAQISLYAMRLDGELYDASSPRISPSRSGDRNLLADGLDQLAGAADGTVIPVAVNAASVFSRLGLELSGYYLLSFAPQPGDRDGRPHRIDVRTTRPNVQLRARREFTVAAEGPRTRADFLLDALKSPLGLSDFPLHATTYHYQDVASGRLKVLVAVTLDRAFNPDGPFSLAWYVTDTQGRVVSIQDEQRVVLPAGAAPGRPQTFAGAVVVDPGVYNLTVAAVDDAGRRATVEHGFEARLTSVGQLRLSDLMVAAPPSAGRTLSPAVDGRITTDTLVAYSELYSAAEPQLESATLTLEIARDDAGRALESSPMRRVGGETRGQRTFEASVPVALLADGDYVARTVLLSNGRAIGTAVRPFTLARASAQPAAPAPVTSIAPFAVRIDPFSRAAVLARPAVGFFLDRLQPAGLPALPEALTPALGLARIGRFDDARGIVERAGVSHYAAPFFVGLSALAAGNLDQAAQQFGASLAAAPDFLPAAYYLGACYATAGRDREAVIAWRSALIADARAPWIYTTLVDALLRTRDLVPALELLADAVSRWPDSDEVRVRLGTAQALSGQPAAAVRTLDPYLSRHPDDADRLLLAMRMLYEARALDTIVDSLPADRERFAKYAVAYQQAGGTELAAVAAWKRVMDRE